MSEFRGFLNEQLQDEEFREQWEKIQPENNLKYAIRGKELICPNNLTIARRF